VHLPTATAVIADPHLGYDETRQHGGEAVPGATLDEAFAPLADVKARHAITRLVIAGDLLEKCLPDGLVGRLLKVLAALRIELAGVVPGNHDRQLSAGLLPLFPNGIVVGDWLVVHGDEPTKAERLVQGHWHPCLQLSGGQRAPCYLRSESHIILPAFSKDAAGVNVLSRLDWNDYEVHVCAGDRVLDFGLLCELRKKLRGGGCARG